MRPSRERDKFQYFRRFGAASESFSGATFFGMGTSGTAQDESRNQRTLRRVMLWIPVWLTVYFVIGTSRMRSPDIVPFSAWALFVFVPNQPSTYTIVFTAIDGKPLDPPVSLESGAFADPHDINGYYLINHLGMALHKGDSADARYFRVRVESNVLPQNRPVEWELINLRYDPLERWISGKTERRTVARFTTP
jgi:hypothetical protein